MHYTCDVLPRRLLDGLNYFRINQIHCDVTIIEESSHSKHLAHRVVLASVSDYFRPMLSGNYKESRQNEIVISGVEDKALKFIIEFIYTSEINLMKIMFDLYCKLRLTFRSLK